jgi:hypothetical protein
MQFKAIAPAQRFVNRTRALQYSPSWPVFAFASGSPAYTILSSRQHKGASMKASIIAAGIATLVAIAFAPTVASAQSRGWLMKQGVFCADGRRALNVEICKRRQMRAAAAAKNKR